MKYKEQNKIFRFSFFPKICVCAAVSSELIWKVPACWRTFTVHFHLPERGTRILWIILSFLAL